MNVTTTKETSEVWFEQYLEDHGIAGGEDHHPDLGVEDGGQADYRPHRDGVAAICEVKEFTTSVLDRRMKEVGPRQPITIGGKDFYKAMRKKIEEAASEQLKPLCDRGEALAVVLANPNGVHVPLEQPLDVIAAMYGNEGYSIGVNLPPGVEDEGDLIFDADGALTGSHRYVSAVITLHRGTHAADARARWYEENKERWDDLHDRQARMAAIVDAHQDPEFQAADEVPGEYYFVRVYSTISTATGQAIPVPRELFNGPRDQYWAMNEKGELELVHGKLD